MAALTAMLSVGLLTQATALKCYQAPLSWGSCWTDPNAGCVIWVYSVYSPESNCKKSSPQCSQTA
jgi:hypothetical protein